MMRHSSIGGGIEAFGAALAEGSSGSSGGSRERYTFVGDPDSSHNYGNVIAAVFPRFAALWEPASPAPRTVADFSFKSKTSKIKRYIDGTINVTAKGGLPKLLAEAGLLDAIGIPTMTINEAGVIVTYLTDGGGFAGSPVANASALMEHAGCKPATDPCLFFIKLNQARFGGGNGIFLKYGTARDAVTTMLSLARQVQKSEWVMQAALPSPALYRGRKWDTRSYVIILSDADRIVAFAYKRAFARVSGSAWTPPTTSRDDEHVHLTNSSLHRKTAGYSAADMKVELNSEAVALLIGHSRRVVEALAPKLEQCGRVGYIILGFDFMFVARDPTAHLNGIEASPARASDLVGPSAAVVPRLIEINDHPAQYLDDAVSGEMVREIWDAMASAFMPALASAREDDPGVHVSPALRWLATAPTDVVNQVLGSENFVRIVSTPAKRTMAETDEHREDWDRQARRTKFVGAHVMRVSGAAGVRRANRDDVGKYIKKSDTSSLSSFRRPAAPPPSAPPPPQLQLSSASGGR